MPPSAAVNAAVAVAGKAIAMQPARCDTSAYGTREFGRLWVPCNAHSAVIRAPDGEIFLTVTAMPTIDAARSRPDHLAFAGSHVLVTVDWQAAPVHS